MKNRRWENKAGFLLFVLEFFVGIMVVWEDNENYFY